MKRLRRRNLPAALALDEWLAEVVSTCADRILPVDHVVAEEWGRLNAPRSTPVIDGLLAATARVHGFVVATRNVRDYARTGSVLNSIPMRLRYTVVFEKDEDGWFVASAPALGSGPFPAGGPSGTPSGHRQLHRGPSCPPMGHPAGG